MPFFRHFQRRTESTNPVSTQPSAVLTLSQLCHLTGPHRLPLSRPSPSVCTIKRYPSGSIAMHHAKKKADQKCTTNFSSIKIVHTHFRRRFSFQFQFRFHFVYFIFAAAAFKVSLYSICLFVVVAFGGVDCFYSAVRVLGGILNNLFDIINFRHWCFAYAASKALSELSRIVPDFVAFSIDGFCFFFRAEFLHWLRISFCICLTFGAAAQIKHESICWELKNIKYAHCAALHNLFV